MKTKQKIKKNSGKPNSFDCVKIYNTAYLGTVHFLGERGGALEKNWLERGGQPKKNKLKKMYIYTRYV